MKLKTPMAIKKGNQIVAVIGTDGKVQSSDKKIKNQIEYLMGEKMIYPKGSETLLVDVDNEGKLYTHMMARLEPHGMTVE